MTFGSLGKKSTRAVFPPLEMPPDSPVPDAGAPMFQPEHAIRSSARWTRRPLAGVRLSSGSFSGSIRRCLQPRPCGRAENRSFDGLIELIFFLFMATAFGWLIRILREELRASGLPGYDDEPNHDPFA